MTDTDLRCDPYERAAEPLHARAVAACASVVSCPSCGSIVPDSDRDRFEACLMQLRDRLGSSAARWGFAGQTGIAALLAEFRDQIDATLEGQ